jgi:hypothetical protein
VAEQLGGLGLAAQICGMAGGNPESEPLTYKAVLDSNLEFSDITLDQIDQLLTAGVTFPFADTDTGNRRIQQALMTFQSDNPSIRLLHGYRIQQKTQRLFDAELARFLGTPLDFVDGESLKTACATMLDKNVRTGANPNGIYTPGFENGVQTPAWRNLTVIGDSNTGWDVECQVSPVGETDYISARVHFVPATISL